MSWWNWKKSERPEGNTLLLISIKSSIHWTPLNSFLSERNLAALHISCHSGDRLSRRGRLCLAALSPKAAVCNGDNLFFFLPAQFLLFIETECGWFPPPTPLPKSPDSFKPLKREVFITELLTTLPSRSSPWWLCSRATEASQTRSTRPNGLKQLASPSQREANYTLSIAGRMTHTEISKACNFKGLIKLHELLTSSCTRRHWRPELCSSRLSAADTTLRKYTHTHDAPLKSVNGCKLPTALSFFLPGLFFFKALRH